MKELSETRKADRAEMARQVAELCDVYGIPYEIDKTLPRETWVKIETPEGLALTCDFDGDSWQPNTFVLSWHIKSRSGYIIAPGFAASRNEYHKRKATDICHGFDDLLVTLENAFGAIKDGIALEPVEPAAT